MTTDATIHRAVLLQRIGVLEVRNRDLEQERDELAHANRVLRRENDDWRAKSVEGSKA